MSEFLHFRVPYNSDQGSGVFDCTPDNTELYYHAPEYADVDHLFIRIDPRDRRIGAFIWRHILGNDEFNGVGNQMISSHNWRVIFSPVPSEDDMQQLAQDVLHIPDELPDDFN